MSAWTHSICEACWNKLTPDRPVRALFHNEPSLCCFCGVEHGSGIFLRYDPALLNCKGAKGYHEKG